MEPKQRVLTLRSSSEDSHQRHLLTKTSIQVTAATNNLLTDYAYETSSGIVAN